MTLTYTDEQPVGSTPIYISPSALQKTICEQALHYQIAGLHQHKTDEAITMGNAVHAFNALSYIHTPLLGVAKAVEIYGKINTDTKPVQDVCMSRPANLLPEPFKMSRTKLVGGVSTITSYPAVEFGFEVPWLTLTLEGKTYCVIVCGIIDHLSFTNSIVRVFDLKTSKNYKLDEARVKYKNSAQFMFYLWAIWKFGHRFLPLELHNAARDYRLTSELVIVQWKVKPPRWSVDAPVTTTRQQLESFEENLRGTLGQTLPAALLSPRKNGWIADRCSWCEYNDLCHALPSTEDAIKESLYFTREHTKTKQT